MKRRYVTIGQGVVMYKANFTQEILTNMSNSLQLVFVPCADVLVLLASVILVSASFACGSHEDFYLAQPDFAYQAILHNTCEPIYLQVHKQCVGLSFIFNREIFPGESQSLKSGTRSLWNIHRRSSTEVMILRHIRRS